MARMFGSVVGVLLVRVFFVFSLVVYFTDVLVSVGGC